MGVEHGAQFMALEARVLAMTPRSFCQSGEAELLKGGVHGAACVILGVMTAYNGASFAYRREGHLLLNFLLYAPATWWEWRQTKRHLGIGSR